MMSFGSRQCLLRVKLRINYALIGSKIATNPTNVGLRAKITDKPITVTSSTFEWWEIVKRINTYSWNIHRKSKLLK
jgi:hypothetical protein